MIDHCQMDADPNDASITELYGGASTARQSPVIEAPQAGCTRHWKISLFTVVLMFHCHLAMRQVPGTSRPVNSKGESSNLRGKQGAQCRNDKGP